MFIPAKLRDIPIDSSLIFQSVTSRDALFSAWKKVLSNGGCAGGDNITIKTLSDDIYKSIDRLSNDILQGNYTPGPLRQVDIPKKKGGVRRLSIPCVIDRIAQSAMAEILTPLLEEEFEDNSYGYRAGRSVKQAVRRIDSLRSSGAGYVVEADIDDFFDSLPHKGMMARLNQSMPFGPANALIALWLEHAAPNGYGVAQGSPLSPLLANLYLDGLDEAFAKKSAYIVRYADDFVILCKKAKNADSALILAKNLLKSAGLSLNEDESRVTHFDDGFRFLGHLFVRSVVLKSEAGKQEKLIEPPVFAAALPPDDKDGKSDNSDNSDKKVETVRSARFNYLFRVLYVMEPGCRLDVRNQSFSVIDERAEGGAQEVLALANKDVGRIELGPGIEASHAALELAFASDTPVAFVNGWGETKGWASPRFAPRAARQMAQAVVCANEEKALDLARRFVQGRICNQRALLNRLNRKRRNKAVNKALSKMNGIIRILDSVEDMNVLRGREGQSAALYWPSLGGMMEHGFVFEKRIRKKKYTCPANIMLNMTANMLARDVCTCLWRAGLHPGFACLHATQDYRDALVYDLMEEFRVPLCESVVATAINTRAVSMDMFEKLDTGWYMGRDGWKKMIRLYEQAAERLVKSQYSDGRRNWRGIIEEQAFRLVAHFEGVAPYEPYKMDY